MAHSMTGFGRGVQKAKNASYVVEVKSVNNRFCEVRIQAPKDLLALEHQITAKIREMFERGKFDVTLKIEQTHKKKSTTLPEDRIVARWKELEALRKKLKIKSETSLADVFPWVHSHEAANEEDALKPFLIASEDALTELRGFRKKEGEKLTKDLLDRVRLMETCVQKVAIQTENTAERRLERLKLRVQELVSTKSINPERLEVELAVLVDKSDVSEEIVRLKSHLKDMHTTLDAKGSVGRKIDFLLQEIHREVNTIGSKASELEVTEHVIQMKTEIERIREQAQNIE